VNSPPVMVRGSSGPPGSPVAPDPAALDAEWAAYSDRSGCADWAGGDGVSAIRLNSAQLAWFFSDTFIGPAGPGIGFSQVSGFAHNAVVVQTGTRLGSAFVTVTGGGACTGPGRPGNAAPVVGGSSDRYWDEDGLSTGRTIVKFYQRYAAGTFPFVPLGTVVAVFGTSELSSAGHGSRYGATAHPAVIPVPSYTPPAGGSPILWGAAVLRLGDTVYVYGTQSPHVSDPLRHLYLARVPVSQLTAFSSWRFYAGAGTWAARQQGARPVPLSADPAGAGAGVASGFSVIKAGGRYWLIQTAAAGTPDINAYPAAAPWGPFDFTAGRLLYRDPSIGLDDAHDFRIMYEARAEPALSAGHDLVISYNVNSEGVSTGCRPMALYTNTVTLPRFVTVPLAAFGPGFGHGAQAGSARSGPPDDPGIARQNPAQWFDSWGLRHGCPPIPAVTSVRASAGSGQVRLGWPDAGLGVRYLVYLHAPGQPGGGPVARTYHDGVTLTGLRPGRYVARVVPANFRKYRGRGAEATFTVR